MMDLLLSRFAFQLAYLRDLVEDIPDERLADQPHPGMNSPAWLLGHLAWAADLVPTFFGAASPHDADWVGLFSMKSRPVPDRSAYPAKDVLVQALVSAHDRAAQAVASATPELLATPFPDPRLRGLVPTIGDAIVHLLTTHEAAHLGQLSAWKRATGFAPLARLQFA